MWVVVVVAGGVAVVFVVAFVVVLVVFVVVSGAHERIAKAKRGSEHTDKRTLAFSTASSIVSLTDRFLVRSRNANFLA